MSPGSNAAIRVQKKTAIVPKRRLGPGLECATNASIRVQEDDDCAEEATNISSRRRKLPLNAGRKASRAIESEDCRKERKERLGTVGTNEYRFR